MTSDPGTSAILTPFCKTDGLYFDGENEPEAFKYTFDKDLKEYFESNFNGLTISPSFKSVKEYYDANLDAIEMNKKMSIQRKGKEEMYVIDVKVDDDID